MDIHNNARTTHHSRMLIVQRLAAGWTVAAVAAAQGVSPKTVRKWRDRHVAEGEAGLADRSSRPRRSPTRLSQEAEQQIEALRRQRLTGPAIARQVGRPLSTIGVVLRRRGLGRLSALTPRPPVIRYQRELPGELIHIDIKKLGRIDGIGHRITPAIAPARATGVASAGSSSMSPSMMHRGWLTPSCFPMNARKARWPSPAAPSIGSPATRTGRVRHLARPAAQNRRPHHRDRLARAHRLRRRLP